MCSEWLDNIGTNTSSVNTADLVSGKISIQAMLMLMDNFLTHTEGERKKMQ